MSGAAGIGRGAVPAPQGSGKCSPPATEDERDDEKRGRDDQQDFRKFRRQAGNAAKTEKRRDQRDHRKNDGPAKHEAVLRQGTAILSLRCRTEQQMARRFQPVTISA